MTGITLWVPSISPLDYRKVWQSCWNLETPGNIKLRLAVNPVANNIRYSWNPPVQQFLDDTDDEWLLSWHSDVIGVPQTLMRLLSWNRPLVSALIFMRTPPVTPHIWQAYKEEPRIYAQRIQDTRQWFLQHKDYMGEFRPFVMDPRPADALVPVSFTSTSCMIMHRAVLEDMRAEVKDVWFKWDDERGGGGEDRRFCQLARKCGYETFVDRSCVVGHLVGDTPTSAADFFTWDYVSTILGTGEPHEIVR